MYSNIFDTVRNKNLDLINAEALLYTSILSGMHPTLSLNQAIDSLWLIRIAKNDSDFLDFFEKGYIKVALHGKYNGSKDGIISYLTDKLYDCVKNNRVSFKFSSLPFLYEGNYDERQIHAIYKAIIRGLSESNTKLSSYDAQQIHFERNSDDQNYIEEYINLIKTIKTKVNGQYIIPSRRRIESFNEKLIRSIGEYGKYEPHSEFSLCLQDIKHHIMNAKQTISNKNQLGQKINSRSYLYSVVEELDYDSTYKKEAKALIDLCYNEVVAASIGDNEDDIIVNENNFNHIFKIIKNDGKTEDVKMQELTLVHNAEYSNQGKFTWGLLSDILNEAKHNESDIDKWYSDIQLYCQNLGVKNIQLNRKKLLVGAIPFVITSVSNLALIKLFNTNLTESFLMLSSAAIAEDILKDTLNPILTKKIYACLNTTSRKAIEDEIVDNKLKQEAIKQLLTQVSLLKKDLGKEE